MILRELVESTTQLVVKEIVSFDHEDTTRLTRQRSTRLTRQRSTWFFLFLTFPPGMEVTNSYSTGENSCVPYETNRFVSLALLGVFIGSVLVGFEMNRISLD